MNRGNCMLERTWRIQIYHAESFDLGAKLSSRMQLLAHLVQE
jgi:hypothetical protein